MCNKKSIIAIASVVFLVFVIFSNLALAQTTTTVSGYFLASTSEELLDKAYKYVYENDSVALQKLLDSGLVIRLKGGLTVYVVKYKTPKIKIRPVGETIEIWTVIEAVKK